MPQLLISFLAAVGVMALYFTACALGRHSVHR